MKSKLYDNLIEYSRKAIKCTKKYFDLNDLKFDHICYQTISKDDYKRALNELKDDIVVIKEIPHAGRMLTVANLKSKIEVNGVNIDRLEISEPKPKRVVRNRKFDHFSFYVKGNFDAAVDSLREQGKKISEIKQIGSHKFIKFSDNGIEIELRNKRLGGSSRVEEGNKYKEQKIKVNKEDKDSNLKKKLEYLMTKIDNEKESKLRALADYQNLQKRVEEQSKSTADIVNISILAELLDILDDFERSIENINTEEKEKVGIRMVRDKLQNLINKHGISEINCSIGDEMDPNYCEAVGVVAVEDEDNTIQEIVQKGYKMDGDERVVRPIKVIIGKKSK